MNAAKPSKLPPRQPCFAIFRGARRIRDAIYEHICEPVQVVECWRGNQRELGVAMTGRQTRFRLENFEGIWEVLDLEAA